MTTYTSTVVDARILREI